MDLCCGGRGGPNTTPTTTMPEDTDEQPKTEDDQQEKNDKTVPTSPKNGKKSKLEKQKDIYDAIKGKDVAKIKELLASMGIQDECMNCLDGSRKQGPSALDIACREGHPEMVQALLDAKADAKAINGASGWTPLMFAAMSGNAEVCKKLIDAGAPINAATNHTSGFVYALDPKEADPQHHCERHPLVYKESEPVGWTALHFASEGGHETGPILGKVGSAAAVKVLLEAKAQVDAKATSPPGATSLHIAVEAAGPDAAKVIDLLGDAGADMTAKFLVDQGELTNTLSRSLSPGEMSHTSSKQEVKEAINRQLSKNVSPSASKNVAEPKNQEKPRPGPTLRHPSDQKPQPKEEGGASSCVVA